MKPEVLVRRESLEDADEVRALNELAFGSTQEADIVERLRAAADGFVSCVAIEGTCIVGHIAFSPVSLDGDSSVGLLALGPMAVRTDRQGRGIGSTLVEAGLEYCSSIACRAVVLVGHADYYPRFGFVPASRFGLECAFEVPDEAFMALEIMPAGLEDRAGTIGFHPAFEIDA